MAEEGTDPVEPAGDLDPVAVVEQWQARAWGDCDLGVVDELIAEPFVRHGPTGTSERTRAELKHDLRQYQRALGRPVITVRDRVVDGDKVWSRTTMTGANLETGEPRVMEWLQIHRVVGGRIVEVWSLYAIDVEWT